MGQVNPGGQGLALNLFDTSAIISLSESGRISHLRYGCTTSLAEWEIGNVVWKRAAVHKEITLDQAHRILGQLGKLVDSIPKVEVSRRSTLQIAVEETITYYDASFIAAAISSKSALITDDSGLASVAKKHVRTASSDDL